MTHLYGRRGGCTSANLHVRRPLSSLILFVCTQPASCPVNQLSQIVERPYYINYAGKDHGLIHDSHHGRSGELVSGLDKNAPRKQKVGKAPIIKINNSACKQWLIDSTRSLYRMPIEPYLLQVRCEFSHLRSSAGSFTNNQIQIFYFIL